LAIKGFAVRVAFMLHRQPQKLEGKLPADATDMQARTEAIGGPKVRLLTLADLDSRTRACKQALALRDGFLADLGGADYATVAQRELSQRGAILGAMLEDQEARWLRGDGVELPEYCTLVNAQRRVLADIGLERRQRDVTPSITEYIAQKSKEDDSKMTNREDHD
jgi:hypothetical protein